MSQKLNKTLPHLLAAGLIVISFLVTYLNLPEPNQNNILRAVFFDVSKGDAILIDTPTREHILIDGGENEEILMFLKNFLAEPQRFKLVVASHNHADHIGGLVHVLAQYDVEKIWLSGAIHTTRVFETFLNKVAQAQQKGTKVEHVKAGDNLAIGQVKIEVLYPLEDFSGIRPEHQHDATLVLKINYGAMSFLLTGDLEADNEQALLNHQLGRLSTTVLKVSHQGSRTSTSARFLTAADPDIGIISVATPNSYGHPHPDTLKRLESRDIAIFRTDQHGTIIIQSDGVRIWVETEKE